MPSVIALLDMHALTYIVLLLNFFVRSCLFSVSTVLFLDENTSIYLLTLDLTFFQEMQELSVLFDQ